MSLLIKSIRNFIEFKPVKFKHHGLRTDLNRETLLSHSRPVNKACDCLSPIFSPFLISPAFSPSVCLSLCLSHSTLASQAPRIKTPEKAWVTTERRKRWARNSSLSRWPDLMDSSVCNSACIFIEWVCVFCKEEQELDHL